MEHLLEDVGRLYALRKGGHYPPRIVRPFDLPIGFDLVPRGRYSTLKHEGIEADRNERFALRSQKW